MSVRGCAYEVGAIVSQAPSFGSLEAAEQTADSHLLEAVSLAVKEDQLAPIYQLRVIDQVEIAESPVWLQLRLMKSGIRPVNNIVDVTNYYLLLYGQPMHAFDYDRLTNHTIVVDRAEVDVPFVTLDGVERTLSADDIVIKDADQVIALAGVMGGAETEVTDQTRRVLLETAVFNPEQIRLTSKRFGLRSESSARFEKGINFCLLYTSDAADDSPPV